MKYNLYINQLKAVELGITNLNQAHIFDLLTTASSWASVQIINNEHFYWVSRQTICRELVLLNLKQDTVYRHFRILEKIGLIIYKKLDKKDCIKITKKGKKYLSNTTEITMSEINPKKLEKLGNESENNSEMNPTYPTTSINPTTNIKKHTKKKIKLNYSEKVEEFKPSEATANVFKKKYPHLEKDRSTYLEIVEQFKDKAINKNVPFINLNAGMRTYIKQEYIKPVKVVRENEINSFRGTGDTVRAQIKNNKRAGLPEQILINEK